MQTPGKTVGNKKLFPKKLPEGLNVKGTDISGQEYNGTTPAAKYWKNGVAKSLTDDAVAHSIFVK